MSLPGTVRISNDGDEPSRDCRGLPPRGYAERMQATELHDAATTLNTLEQAFRWAIAQDPQLRPADVVIQDEYSHDVLFRAHDGSYLVFDTT
jgi:hypothetical protein